MTYSIVARDPSTGDLGIAVQTRNLAVGATVPWLRAGLGAVATQALTDPTYGPRILECVFGGASARSALSSALANDAQSDLRQIGVVDQSGETAAHTGTGCLAHAEQITAHGLVVLGNMLRHAGTVDAMAEAYEAGSEEPFARRLLGGLLAGEAHGGDLRGQQSAALVVVSDTAGARTPDLRVDDHPEPLRELARMLELQEAYALLQAGLDDLFAGREDAARGAIAEALRRYPKNPHFGFWQRAATASSVQDLGPEWVELARRLSVSGRLPVGWVDRSAT